MENAHVVATGRLYWGSGRPAVASGRRAVASGCGGGMGIDELAEIGIDEEASGLCVENPNGHHVVTGSALWSPSAHGHRHPAASPV